MPTAGQIHFETCYREVREHIGRIPANVPAHRKASKQVYSFSGHAFEQQLAVWDYIWNHSNEFWIKVHAFFFLERHMKKDKLLIQMWPVIVQWQDRVDDWGLCDALAKIYTRVLVVQPAGVYSILEKWNKNDDLWKRRQSVVSLLYYSRTRKIHLPFAKIEKLVSALLKDKEYYVQKGVGWTLREMHNVYPEATESFLRKNIRSVSSIAFTIAIEKMGEKDKNKLKALRKA